MKHVLIVEDDLLITRMYDRAFKLAGFELSFANDGEQALAVLQSGAELPSVIVMDVLMPKMGGADFLRAVKKDPRLKNIPTVVLTNSFAHETAEEFKAIGADLYLVKVEHSMKSIVEQIDGLIAARAKQQ